MESQLYHTFAQNEMTHWWFVGRREIFSAVFKKLLQKKELQILDVGCGTGGNLPLLAGYGNVVGIDNSPTAVAYAKTQGYTSVICADASKLPFADNSFDCVVAIDIIEHMQDDSAFVKELHRVLTPEGFAVLSTAAFSFLWSSHDTRNQHWRRYTKKQLTACFPKNLWLSKIVRYYNFIFFPVIAVIRLCQKLIPERTPKEGAAWELATPPTLFNAVLHSVLAAERFFLRFPIPWGVSLLAVYQKRK